MSCGEMRQNLVDVNPITMAPLSGEHTRPRVFHVAPRGMDGRITSKPVSHGRRMFSAMALKTTRVGACAPLAGPWNVLTGRPHFDLGTANLANLPRGDLAA